MIYLVVCLLLGILFLIIYYSKVDSVERKYALEFEKHSDSRNAKIKTIWSLRKETTDRELKKQLTIILFLRYLSFAAVIIPFILYLLRDKV